MAKETTNGYRTGLVFPTQCLNLNNSYYSNAVTKLRNLFSTPSVLMTSDYLCPTKRTVKTFNVCELFSAMKNLTLFPRVYADTTKNEDLSHQVASGEFKKPTNFVTDEMIQEYLANETGWERVRNLWKKDYKGDYSPQAEFTGLMTIQSSFVAFFIASYYGSRESKENFQHKNQVTKFQTRFRAIRAFNDASFIGGTKAGALWALKFGSFVGIILFTSQSIAAYRNKSSFIEYGAGGAVAGGCFRFAMGPRAMLVASVLGGILGTIGGVLIYGAMRFNNDLQEQRHHYFLQNKIHLDMYNKGQLKTPPSSISGS